MEGRGTRPSNPQAPARSAASRKVPYVALVLVVAIVVLLGIAFWIGSHTTSLECVGSCSKAFGATVGRSLDGTNWTVTLTVIPSPQVYPSIQPSTTLFELLAANGTGLLAPTPLSAFPGGLVSLVGSTGKLYLRYQGVVPGSISVGDVVYVGTTFVGPGGFTKGCEVQLWVAGDNLYQGTLQ